MLPAKLAEAIRTSSPKTDLELVDQAGGVPEAWPVIARVLLFLPSAASVVGLLCGLRDPACLCLHDRISGTRVIPLAPPSGAS